MSIHVVLEGLQEQPTRAELELYWHDKVGRIRRLLKGYPDDLYELRLTVHASSKSDQTRFFEARGVVRLPTGTLVCQREGKDVFALVDQIVDNLVRQVKRHRELVRKDYLYKRKNRARRDLAGAEPLLARDKSRGRRDDFFRLLRPLLHFLSDHAARELRVLEMDGVLHPGEVSVEDLLDEVLTEAWQQFDRRPQGRPLHLWLTELLHQALDRLIKQEPRAHDSLEVEVLQTVEDLPVQEVQVGEDEWWAALLGYGETLTLEDLVPGCDTTAQWESLEPPVQRERVMELLGRLPARQRQALLLFAVEDYDPAEIALLQNRSQEEVQRDIDSAREQLRQWLLQAQHIQPPAESSS